MGKNYFSVKFLIIPVLLLVLLLGGAIFRQIMKFKTINREISILEKEINKLEVVNKSIIDNLNYYKTLDFLERESRMRLGMKKVGEKVAVVVEPQVKKEEYVEDPRLLNYKEKIAIPTWQKWIFYFFRKDLL